MQIDYVCTGRTTNFSGCSKGVGKEFSVGGGGNGKNDQKITKKRAKKYHY